MHNTDFDFCPPMKPDHGHDTCKPPMPPIPQPPVPVCPPHHGNPKDCLINPYNKICFNDKKEATQLLLNKDLFAGQIAIAYYYDNCNAHGVNAIAAVGNIKVGAPNIIFDNIEDIKRWRERLYKTDKEHDVALNALRADVDNALAKLSYINESNDKIDSLDQSLASLIEDNANIHKAIDGIDNSIEVLGTDIDTINTNVSELSELISKIEDSINDINGGSVETNDSISALNSSINTWIERHLSDVSLEHTAIVTDFENKLSDLSLKFSNSTGDVSNALGNAADLIYAELSIVENRLTDSIINVANDLSSDFKKADDKVKSDLTQDLTDKVSVINGNIETLTQKVDNLSSKSDSVNSDIDAAVADAKRELSDALDAVKIDAETELVKITDEIKQVKQELDSTIDALKSEYSGDIESKISELRDIAKSKHLKLKLKLEGLESALYQRCDTIEKSIDTKLEVVKDEFTDALRNMKKSLVNEYTKDVAKQKDLNDLRYMAKGEVTQIEPAYHAGILLNNNKISLDIDVNGILHFNGAEYQLERVR